MIQDRAKKRSLIFKIDKNYTLNYYINNIFHYMIKNKLKDYQIIVDNKNDILSLDTNSNLN